jgi:hypothetical protein
MTMRQVPFGITFRNIDRSDGLERPARKRIARLSALSDRILAGRVTIEARQRAGYGIKAYGARVEPSLPGGSIVALRCGIPSSEGPSP